MAQAGEDDKYRPLHIDTAQHITSSISEDINDLRLTRSSTLRQDETRHGSQDTIHATETPPISIPNSYDENALLSASPIGSRDSYIEQYLRDRHTAIKLDEEIKTSAGHRHSILEPPGKPIKSQPRGRALASVIARQKPYRAHSESDRTHYDPFTGRHLPQWSTSPPHESPRVGEARFPLLQQTVDELARQSQENLSLYSGCQGDSNEQVSSPVSIAPFFRRQNSSSYQDLPTQRRKASERWRDGEMSTSFFERAGSLKSSGTRQSRRDTNSTRSPQSAASSYLRSISMSQGSDGNSAPAVDAVGATIGDDYVLGKQIGYGGFSVIKEATQISSHQQRKLAVKIVRKQIVGKSEEENQQAQSEFEHEVDLWRLLSHRNILNLEAVYNLEEATFCFIPLNTGGTLFDLMSNRRDGLADEVAANYIFQLTSALRYLHLDARVVHRDVKLENCLIDTTTSPPLLRLCDFGLAEWTSSDSDSSSNPDTSRTSFSDSSDTSPYTHHYRQFGPAGSSSAAFAGGSLEYAAPEILKLATSNGSNLDLSGSSHAIIDPAVDIWALGVCAFSLLMGRRPFQDSFQPRIVMAILAGDWPRSKLKSRARLEAYQLVKACLEMKADSRPGIADIHGSEWLTQARDEEQNRNGVESEKGSWRL